MAGPSRTHHQFRTRQYNYGTNVGASEAAAAGVHLTAGQVYRFILGVDSQPVALSLADISAALNDPFAKLILQRGASVLSLRALLSELDKFNTDPIGLPSQHSFVVADGGQIPWSKETDKLNRQIRFAIARSTAPASLPDLFISTSSDFESIDTFLQVIGWDPVALTHQFYERREGAWVWAGSSWHALDPKARGKGPFDSHVNGAVNMKELKLPWINWHSQSAVIDDNILAPDDPLRHHPLWTRRSPAQELETSIVRPGIHRWTGARFQKCTAGPDLTHLPDFFRQVLETTTVNLVSSAREFKTLSTGGAVDLPLTFFINSDLFFDDFDIDANFDPLTVDAAIYSEVMKRFEVACVDETGQFRFQGDTHFAFVVPEPAFEDNAIVRGLISAGVLSPKLAACLLMVDFCNPVFSRARAALLRYVPEKAVKGSPDAFSAGFVSGVQNAAAALPSGSPEHQFLQLWAIPDAEWQSAFGRRISAFISGVAAQLTDAGGFARVFQLAESRRREFRRRRLAEFRLTTPTTNIPESAQLLEFAPDGTVQNKS